MQGVKGGMWGRGCGVGCIFEGVAVGYWGHAGRMWLLGWGLQGCGWVWLVGVAMGQGVQRGLRTETWGSCTQLHPPCLLLGS